MEKILSLIVNFLVEMWQTFDKVMFPFGDKYYSLTQVLATFFAIFTFAKILGLLFGFWTDLDAELVAHEQAKAIRERKKEQAYHLKNANKVYGRMDDAKRENYRNGGAIGYNPLFAHANSLDNIHNSKNPARRKGNERYHSDISKGPYPVGKSVSYTPLFLWGKSPTEEKEDK